MLVVDLRSEVEMGGVAQYIGNSSGKYARETVEALTLIGCPGEAAKLAAILDLADSIGMTHDAIQADRSGLAPYAVTTFRQVHGDKWEETLDTIDDMGGELDFGEMFTKLEELVGNHRGVFEAVLESTASVT